jgi:type II secretory pathway pseudopilin PulG
LRCQPFTLVEILVALVVTAVIVPITLRALMLAAGLSESAVQHRQALYLADLKLQELVATGAWLTGDGSGEFGDDYRGYRWELATDSWSAVNVSMRRLDLTVHGPARHGESMLTLTTLVPESLNP